jgi:hypothetical protein
VPVALKFTGWRHLRQRANGRTHNGTRGPGLWHHGKRIFDVGCDNPEWLRGRRVKVAEKWQSQKSKSTLIPTPIARTAGLVSVSINGRKWQFASSEA